MTYNVFGGTLNLTQLQPPPTICSRGIMYSSHLSGWPAVRCPSGRQQLFCVTLYFFTQWRDSIEAWHKYSSRQWELLRRFFKSEVKVMIHSCPLSAIMHFRWLLEQFATWHYLSFYAGCFLEPPQNLPLFPIISFLTVFSFQFCTPCIVEVWQSRTWATLNKWVRFVCQNHCINRDAKSPISAGVYRSPVWQDLSPVFTFYLRRVWRRPPHACWWSRCLAARLPSAPLFTYLRSSRAVVVRFHWLLFYYQYAWLCTYILCSFNCLLKINNCGYVVFRKVLFVSGTPTHTGWRARWTMDWSERGASVVWRDPTTSLSDMTKAASWLRYVRNELAMSSLSGKVK